LATAITLGEIEAARRRLQGVVLHTPLVYTHALSRESGREVFLKLENLQTTGSFKLRGAVNRLTLLKERREGARVVAASAGNHGQGVALAAAHLNIPAVVVMPQGASISKQEACRGYGAEVVLHGQDLSQALQRARELAAQGYIFIHPYDDPEVMAGQGTVGLEILEDLPAVDTVVVPVGGGGLAAGTALALKALKPAVRVIGVQTAQVPSLAAALKAGAPTPVPSRPTLADGINVPLVGIQPFPWLRDCLSEVVLVEETDIVQALLFLLEGKKVLAEGAGAVATAAYLGGLSGRDLGRQVVLLVSGLLNLRVALSDRPGSLGRLTVLLGEQGANILHLFHDRLARELPLDYTRVEINLEIRGPEHGEAVLKALRAAGYQVEEKG
jgi:threonine dehydratase